MPHFKITIFFFVDGVDDATGPLSVVPGSHRYEDKPPNLDRLTDMPDHVNLTGPAGSAVLWNGCLWHTAMDNTDTKPRRMILYNYCHLGEGQHAPCVLQGEFRERMRRQRSPLCRQLLGIERTVISSG